MNHKMEILERQLIYKKITFDFKLNIDPLCLTYSGSLFQSLVESLAQVLRLNLETPNSISLPLVQDLKVLSFTSHECFG